MNKLEAQIIVQNTGNYEEEEIEEVLDVYEEVIKHVGFKDERRDKRFIVKFHSIFYYMPEEYEKEHEEEFNYLFDEFCEQQYDYIIGQEDIDANEMLSPMYVGHYQAFVVDIPEITEENAIDVAMKAYDEFNYKGGQYVKNYIYLVDLLKDLEDNYMDYWIDFLEESDFPQKYLKQIKENYKSDKEKN